ncbi:MAG: RNA methyltransferase [Cyclobacteriaceae bacterium]|nr:RNA methyltransferase [Cyclobacteriaceae bacterium]
MQEKKYRKLEQCFLVEGEKSVLELLESDFKSKMIVGTATFLSTHHHLLNHLNCIEATEQELSGLGEFRTNKGALAVVEIKHTTLQNLKPSKLYLVLDNIQDPGNLGTIIRTADWYGIQQIIVSEDTVEFYNPKVIAATKGSFTRVEVVYTDIKNWLLQQNQHSIYGALLGGENVRHTEFDENAILIIGNEAHGIRLEILPLIQKKITIPKYGKAESLNAAIATAILLDRMVS